MQLEAKDFRVGKHHDALASELQVEVVRARSVARISLPPGRISQMGKFLSTVRGMPGVKRIDGKNGVAINIKLCREQPAINISLLG